MEHEPTTAVAMIAAERHEQRTKHGFSDAYDDQHTDDELLNAAVAVLTEDLERWPGKMDRRIFFNATEKGEAERRAVGAALIAADIDRILRARERSGPLPVLKVGCRVRLPHNLYDVLYADGMDVPTCEHLAALADREGEVEHMDEKAKRVLVKVDGLKTAVDLPYSACIPLPEPTITEQPLR